MAIASRISVWADGESPTPSEYWGMYFEAGEAGVVVSLTKARNPPSVTLETSSDGATWTAFDPESDAVTLANVGDKVYFRAGTGGNTHFASSFWDHWSFSLSGAADCGGNIMSLIDGEDEDNLVIPAEYCFADLFNGCSNLTSLPDLPATTLTRYCYSGTFSRLKGSTPLTAPALPATATLDYAYYYMFYDSSAITEIAVPFTSWPQGMSEWVAAVAATGTFKCPAALGTDSTISRGNSYCPNGWTVVNI